MLAKSKEDIDKCCKGEYFMQLKYVDTKEEIIAINRKSKHIEPHLHNALEIVCVTSGSLELGVGQELYHMEKGDIGFVFPDVIHHYQVLTPGVNKATYLIASPFTIAKFADIMQSMAPEYPIIKAEKVEPEVYRVINAILETEQSDITVAQAYLQIVLARCIGKLNLVEKSNVGSNDLIYQTVSYISANFKKKFSLEEMAKSPLIDAVYIASPNFLHAEQSILCMKHGKHVLCEKPFASNAWEVREMIAASAKYDVTLMEAMKPTLTPNFRSVRENLGRLGTIRRYFSCYCQYSSRYDKFKEGVVLNAFRPELSNGAMMDIGIYTVYPMVVLFGRPKKIDASGIVLSSSADGQGAVNFEYEGMNATVLYSKIANSSLPTEIQGEEGNITLDRINIIGEVKYTPRLAAASGRGPSAEAQDISVVTDKDEYYYEVAEFIDLVLSGKRQSGINSHEHSLITLEIIDEVRRQLGIRYPADRY